MGNMENCETCFFWHNLILSGFVDDCVKTARSKWDWAGYVSRMDPLRCHRIDGDSGVGLGLDKDDGTILISSLQIGPRQL